MAQHRLEYRNIFCWVTVDTKKLRIYGKVIDHVDKSISGWITSEPGKSYEIHWQDKKSRSRTTGFSVDVFVDDVDVGGQFRDPHMLIKDSHFCFDGVPTSSMEKRALVFDPINTGDNDELLDGSTPDFGTITIQWCRANACEDPPGDLDFTLPTHLTSQQITVHEKKKKAGSHRTMLGETSAALYTENYVDYLDNDPWTFNFYYCPLAILQAKGYAPLLRTYPNFEPGHELEIDPGLDSKPIEVSDSEQDEARALEELEESQARTLEIKRRLEAIRVKKHRRHGDQKHMKLEHGSGVKVERRKAVQCSIDLTISNEESEA